MSGVVVYTAISQNYDILIEQEQSACYVAFMDQFPVTATWTVRYLFHTSANATRRAKKPKILSHVYFPEEEYTLWIDGNIHIEAPIGEIMELMPKEVDVLVHKHPERDCIYDEAKICIERNLDDRSTIDKQIERYAQENYPKNNGLVEASIILRRNTNRTRLFNELWWEEIQKGSQRDQLSFNYAAYKTGLAIGYFPITYRNDPSLFTSRLHRKKYARWTSPSGL